MKPGNKQAENKTRFYAFLTFLGITNYCRVNYNNSFLELTNYDPLIKKEIPKEGQRVVLHVGPHKTGSTSVQASMIKWTDPSSNVKSNQLICSPKNTHPLRKTSHACGANSKALLDTWKWPAPKKNGWSKNAKSFSELVKVLSNIESKHWPLNSEETFALYRTQIFNNWSAGKNLFISAELFDSVTIHKHLIANLMNFMAPAISVQDITVVVVYRAPRIENLLSLWHMWGAYQTFNDYIIQGARNLSVIDSLGITNEFLAKGFKVDLIDTSGLSSQGYDLSNVVACDILKVQCNLNKTIIGVGEEKPVIKNKKRASQSLNVTTEQLRMIDDAIKRFDCIYEGILLHVNVTLHYPDLLLKNNFECSIDKSEILPNQIRRQRLVQEMQDILMQ